MRRIDLTQDFRAYRDAIRLIWNTFLCNCSDRENTFPEVDMALFHAILESQLDATLKPAHGRVLYYANLEVSTSDRLGLLLSETSESNFWLSNNLPKNIRLQYSGLFDFESDGEAYRDFQYVRCVANPQRSGVLPDQDVWLIQAHAATVSFTAFTGADDLDVGET